MRARSPSVTVRAFIIRGAPLVEETRLRYRITEADGKLTRRASTRMPFVDPTGDPLTKVRQVASIYDPPLRRRKSDQRFHRKPRL